MSVPRLGSPSSLDEASPARVIAAVLEGCLDVAAAAKLLKKSVRQVYRMLAAARSDKGRTFEHGNIGREPPNKIPRQTWDEIIRLARETYSDLNDAQLYDVLKRHHYKVGRESLRKQLRSAGIPTKRPQSRKVR